MPFIDCHSGIWRKFIESNAAADIYHLPGYAALDAEMIGGRAIAYISPHHGDLQEETAECSSTPHPGPLTGQILIPLIERKVDGGYFDLVSPYGFPGILAEGAFADEKLREAEHSNSAFADGKLMEADYYSGAVADEGIREMLECFNREAAQMGYISSFMRLNPLINNWDFLRTNSVCEVGLHEASLHEAGMYEAVLHEAHEIQSGCYSVFSPGRTLSVDPYCLEGRLFYNENVQRNLSRLRKLGYRAVINDWSMYGDFQKAYCQTMIRKNTSPYYHFPERYFRKLRELAGDHLILISVIGEAPQHPQYLGGALFTCYNGVMQYHLSGTTDEAVWLSPSKLILETATHYALEHQVKTLHLGGGAGGVTTDGLYRFKRCFATHSQPFTCLKFIHRPGIYARLCRGRKSDYFPEYRLSDQ